MYTQNIHVTPESISSIQEITLLDFGTNWCGFCQAASALINAELKNDIKHIKIEDGPGRKLGRFFKVKLWPTLILVKDGKEIRRLTRPETAFQLSKFFNLDEDLR